MFGNWPDAITPFGQSEHVFINSSERLSIIKKMVEVRLSMLTIVTTHDFIIMCNYLFLNRITSDANDKWE